MCACGCARVHIVCVMQGKKKNHLFKCAFLLTNIDVQCSHTLCNYHGLLGCKINTMLTWYPGIIKHAAYFQFWPKAMQQSCQHLV